MCCTHLENNGRNQFCILLDHVGPILISLDNIGLLLLIFLHFWPFITSKTILDHFRQIKKKIANFQQNWIFFLQFWTLFWRFLTFLFSLTVLKHFKQFWSNLDHFNHLDHIGPSWTNLDHFGTFWNLGWFWTKFQHLGPFGTFFWPCWTI